MEPENKTPELEVQKTLRRQGDRELLADVRRSADREIFEKLGKQSADHQHLKSSMEDLDRRVTKHDYALFGIEGSKGLMDSVSALDTKVDAVGDTQAEMREEFGEKVAAVSNKIDDRFSRIQKAAIASIATFLLTTLPTLVVIILTSHG